MTTLAAPSLEERLAHITTSLELIESELAAQRDVREKWQELVRELTPVGAEAMAVATRELQELEPDVSAEEMARFVRTFVRAMPKLEMAITQLESAIDLVGEATRIGGAGVSKLSDTLSDAEREGYFGVVEAMPATFRAARDVRTPPSALALLRQLRDPRVRLGIARALTVVRALGAGADHDHDHHGR